LEPHDFARCRWCASLWFRGRAHASHLAVISAVDLANGQGRGLGLAHRLESGSKSVRKLCAFEGRSSKPPSLAIMSQVAKSASAFVRAFLAILVLKPEDMVVHWLACPHSAAFHTRRWTVRLVPRLTSGVPLGAGLGARI